MRLRNITPKSLFGRMLAIILVPIILVQIISVSIFYERHWDWVSRHMSKMGSISKKQTHTSQKRVKIPKHRRALMRKRSRLKKKYVY